MPELIGAIKQAAIDAVTASNPTTIFFGIVTGTDPLTITAEQKLELDEDQLVLARNVTEHWIEMTVDHETVDYTYEHSYEHTHDITVQDSYSGGGSGSASTESVSFTNTHRHDYKGRKRFLLHNQLVTGEKVILLRLQGGQKFIVIDRLGDGQNVT